MKKKDPLLDELNEQAPLLGSLKEKAGAGFQVPEGYFSGLENEVFRQLDAIGAKRRPAPAPERPSLWQFLERWWRPRTALALAGMLTLALAAWWYFRPAAAEVDAMAANAVTAEDAEAYLFDNLMELDPAQLAAALPAEKLPAISLPTNPERPSAEPEIELRPEDLDNLLRDLTDEELRELL